MNRSELIGMLAAEKNISNEIAETIVIEIFKSMSDTLISGNRIEIRGFGSFGIREYVGRNGRNPKTGMQITLKPKKIPFFKVGKDLKERILDSGNQLAYIHIHLM